LTFDEDVHLKGTISTTVAIDFNMSMIRTGVNTN